MSSSSASATGNGLFRRSSVPQSHSRHVPHQDTPAPEDNTTNKSGTTPNPISVMGMKAKKECFVFEPQQWRRTVCKNCFRTEPEHKQSANTKEGNASGPSVVLRRAENVVQVPASGSVAQTQGESAAGEAKPQEVKSDRDSVKTGGSTNATRAALRKTAAIQGQSNAHGDGRRAGGQNSAGGIHSSASSIDARYIEELENDFFALEDKHEAVLRERNELTAELEAKVRSVTELQTALEQYKEKVSLLERRCLHLEEEIKGYRERLRLPESDQSHQPVGGETRGESPTAAGSMAEIACSSELQQRLNEVEQLCQEVMEENEQLKEEVEEMQREIEEMHDHFQEDDRDAMRELQRDLEAANKTCRILQFKLRKAERRFEQCEAERANLEERLARLEAELYSEADVAHIRNLEEEVRVAKEVGVRLNNELDILDEKRAYFEQENRQLKEELQVSQNRRIQVENELGRVKLEMDKVKSEKGILDKGPLQVTDKNRSRQSNSRPSLSREASFEEQQLQRELDASRERETDLSEQLRFAEEEIRKLKRRVKDSQVENEMLTKKMDRILATQSQDLYQPSSVGRQSNTSAAQVSPKTGPREGDGRLPPGQLENELIMTRRQLDMAEEENLTLRRKVLNFERELNAAHAELQRLQNRAGRGMPLDSPELETLRTQMNQVQTHLNRLEGERDRLEGENRRLRAQTPMAGKPAASEDTEETTIDRLTKQNEALTQRIKEWNKRLRQLTREVNLVGSIEREHEWMEKYNDARESLKEQETQLLRVKKRVSELQDENARLRAEERKVEQRERREREKIGNVSNMTREVMMQEISALEEELDEVTADLTAAREQACTAQLRVTFLEDTTGELRAETERRERELTTYIGHLESKNQVVNKLLEILQERTENLQTDLDRYLGIPHRGDSMEASAESRTSTFSTASAGSDEVFDDSTETGKAALDIEHQLRNRVSFLERLLEEERRKTEIAENQLQQSNVIPNADGQLKSRQMDLLKKELEEKDELIEARDEQIADLKSRVDQARKMNDALRSLMEKDSGTEKGTVQNVESSVEMASYRKEIESARKEMQILRTNLGQAEKIRERLVKENRELQEELKLREDSIFDQDDEIEKRNAELRTVKANLEAVQKELEQTRRDLSAVKQRESSGSSGRLSAQIAQNEKIRADLHETTRQLNEMKLKYDEAMRAGQTADEKFTQLSADMNQLRGTLQEKDSIIIDLNKNLKKNNEDMSEMRHARQNLEKERSKLEKLLEEVKKDLSAKDQEIKSLHVRLDSFPVKMFPDRPESSQESGLGTPDNSSTRDGGTLSRRSAEVDRLRRELSMMRRERDDLATEVKQLRSKLRAKEEGSKKDQPEGLIGLPTGNAYAKAIAAQQTTTKISLLNEHIASLNRTNVELKLHNESLQNTVIDLQRRYRSLKEQYEGEQETWLTERVVLESKAKEVCTNSFIVLFCFTHKMTAKL
ncbi:Prefoldin [Fasciola hepatica]|uniref:Prefoldin n=1 Tax=Fasciola hepatica TaxID=6192 RepID=A0A4E0S252_FASHE|nr:Prefoldin [Fasciola hepatica]